MSDRLRVGIVGAGRVGPVIGAALAGAGHAIVSITSGSDDDRVAAILPGVPIRDPQDVVRESHTVAGRVSGSLGILDRDDALRLFDDGERAAIGAVATDRSHRWAGDE